MKLCPLSPATLAGQNAINTHAMSIIIIQIVLIVHPSIDVANIVFSSFNRLLLLSASYSHLANRARALLHKILQEAYIQCKLATQATLKCP